MKTTRAYKLESCVVSLEQALRVQKQGADRVEICANLELDGMTPSYHLTSAVCDRLKIPVRVMIRATSEGFAVDSHLLVEMIRAINEFKHLPIDGFVLGVMKNNRIDREMMEELIHQVTPFPITFHKAIDVSEDIDEDMYWLNQQTCIDTLLTSGGAIKAIDGMAKIKEMKSRFNGEIMAAGKIIPEDLPVLANELQLSWYHGSAIV